MTPIRLLHADSGVCDNCVKAFPSSCHQVVDHRSDTGFVLDDSTVPERSGTGPDGFSILTPLLIQFPCEETSAIHMEYGSHPMASRRTRDPIQWIDADRGEWIPFHSMIHSNGNGSCFFIARADQVLKPATTYRLIISTSIASRFAGSFQQAFDSIRRCEAVSDYETEKKFYSLPPEKTILYTDTFRTRSTGPLISRPRLIYNKLKYSLYQEGKPDSIRVEKEGDTLKLKATVPEICSNENSAPSCRELFEDTTGRLPPSSKPITIQARLILPDRPGPIIRRGSMFSRACGSPNQPEPTLAKIESGILDQGFVLVPEGCEGCRESEDFFERTYGHWIEEWQWFELLRGGLSLPEGKRIGKDSSVSVIHSSPTGCSWNPDLPDRTGGKDELQNLRQLPYSPLSVPVTSTTGIYDPFSSWFNGKPQLFFEREILRLVEEPLTPAPYLLDSK